MTAPKFDRRFWYSGFDGRYFAELLPARLNYWFINILGHKYFVSSDIAIIETKILPYFQTYKFNFDRATWQYQQSAPFSQNPFLALTAPQPAIALCQAQNQSLPQAQSSSSIKVFESQPLPKSRAYTYFIVTEDYQYLKIGFSKNPSSRLSELQATRPQALSYLGSFVSDSERYKNICQRFEHLFIRNGWYNFSTELRDYVANLLSYK
jgi:hypothetical protein